MCTSINDGTLLIQIECKYCRLIFFLCRSCFRGHRYCGEQCRRFAETEAHRKSQSRYRTSGKGRETNKIGAKRRRTGKNKKSVADEGSTSPPPNDTVHPVVSPEKPKCRFCGISGRAVAKFPRRGYGPAISSGTRIPRNVEIFGDLEKTKRTEAL